MIQRLAIITMEVRSEQSFSIGMQNFPVPTKPSISGMRLTVTNDGTAVYKQVTTPTNPTPAPPISSVSVPPFPGGNSAVCIGSDGPSAAQTMAVHGLNVAAGELVKKKRGRPRKYAPDGSMALGLTPVSPTSATPPGIGGFSPLSMGQTNMNLSDPGDPNKKAKGRPPGSGKKQQLLALGNVVVIVVLFLIS